MNGSINCGVEAESIGDGLGIINLGAVAKVEYSMKPGLNIGLLAKAFANGDNTDNFYNIGVDA